MTTDDSTNGQSTEFSEPQSAALPKLEKNMKRIQELTQRLMGAMSNKREVAQDLQGPAARCSWLTNLTLLFL